MNSDRTTVEAWCRALVLGRDLAVKLAPPPPPALDDDASWEAAPDSERLAAPGRPPELVVVARSPKSPTRGALRRVEVRARLVHTLAHHELQAAELFAWAVLAFADAPRAFRSGLVRLTLDELDHLRSYAEHLERLGSHYGAFEVRDWFWQRVPSCPSPLHFCAFVGLGLEGANLEHTVRYADWFRAAGDDVGAALLERVEREEVAHVALARTWSERFAGRALDFESWAALLPAPLSPALLRGLPLNVAARRRAGFDDAFLARLESAPAAHVRRVDA